MVIYGGYTIQFVAIRNTEKIKYKNKILFNIQNKNIPIKIKIKWNEK